MLALRTTDHRFFIVAMAAEDAVALAIMPDATDSGRPPRRLHLLLETTLAALGARLTEVRLRLGRDDVLRASLQVQGPAGELSLPAHFADGVALAYRGRLPLRMTAEDLIRVPLVSLTAEELPLPISSSSSQTPPSPAPPDAFRVVIDALDLDDFGPRRGEASA